MALCRGSEGWMPLPSKPPSYVAKYELGDRVLEYLDIATAIGFDPGELIRSLAEG